MCGEQNSSMSTASFGPMSDKTYEIYREDRQRLLDLTADLERTFDKWMLTLCGGALGLSLTFAANIVGPGKALSTWALVLAWATFALSLLFLLLAMRLSVSVSEKFVEVMDREAVDGGEKYFARVRAKHAKVPFARCARLFSNAALFIFILGLVFIGIFVDSNIGTLGDTDNGNQTSAGE